MSNIDDDKKKIIVADYIFGKYGNLEGIDTHIQEVDADMNVEGYGRELTDEELEQMER